MNPLDVLLLSLATWRLAYFLTKENAPFNLMLRFRQWRNFGGLLDCIYCTSIWCAAGLYALYGVAPEIVYILAFSGGAMMLYRYTGGEHL